MGMMQTLFWKRSEAAAAAKGVLVGPDGAMPAVLRTDSREIRQGEGFAAIPGASVDGHHFVSDALARGATFFLLQSDRRNLFSLDAFGREHAVLWVENTEKALEEMGLAYLARFRPRRRIAVTGSVGKTTTKELVRNVLSPVLRVHSPAKSHNTRIGCALTALSMPVSTEVLLLEMGANAPGEIRELTETYEPDTAVITEIAPAHLEGFGSLEGVLDAKWEITCSRQLRILSYNYDNDLLRGRVETAGRSWRLLPVGYNVPSGQGVRILHVESHVDGTVPRLSVRYDVFGKTLDCSVPLFGIQHAYTAAFGFALGIAFEQPLEELAQRLGTMTPPQGRGVLLFREGGGLLIDEAYNANPASLSIALDNLFSLRTKEERVVAILGGMRELGKESAVWHARLLEKARCCDVLFLVGKEWKDAHVHEEQGFREGHVFFAADAEEALAVAKPLLAPKDILLVKGSRYYELEKVVRGLARKT
jgi:UDP-N-acetylmuramoyl-tripeptide--D-alanyl-D-alanine ligase